MKLLFTLLCSFATSALGQISDVPNPTIYTCYEEINSQPNVTYITTITSAFCGALSNGLGVDECHLSGHINKSEAIAKRFKDDSKFTYDFSIRNQEYNASVIPVSNISSSFDTCRKNFWAAWVGCECS